MILRGFVGAAVLAVLLSALGTGKAGAQTDTDGDGLYELCVASFGSHETGEVFHSFRKVSPEEFANANLVHVQFYEPNADRATCPPPEDADFIRRYSPTAEAARTQDAEELVPVCVPKGGAGYNLEERPRSQADQFFASNPLTVPKEDGSCYSNPWLVPSYPGNETVPVCGWLDGAYVTGNILRSDTELQVVPEGAVYPIPEGGCASLNQPIAAEDAEGEMVAASGDDEAIGAATTIASTAAQSGIPSSVAASVNAPTNLPRTGHGGIQTHGTNWTTALLLATSFCALVAWRTTRTT